MMAVANRPVSIRVPDLVWDAVKKLAKHERRTVTAVLLRALEAYDTTIATAAEKAERKGKR